MNNQVKDPKKEDLYYCIFFVALSAIPLISAIITAPGFISKYLSSVGGFSSEATLRIQVYRVYLLVLGFSFCTAFFAAYKFKLFKYLSNRSKNIVLAVFIPLILLAMIEGAGRIVLKIKGNAHLLYIDHPYLLQVLKPNTKFDNITINSMGYRGKEFLPVKSADMIRIACLGGSATFCANVPDSQTWCQRMEDILNKEAGSDFIFEVINAGVPGYTTAESLINFNLRIIDLKPDILVLYHSYNDFKPNRVDNFESDYSHWRRLYGKVKKSIIKKYFLTPAVLTTIYQRLSPGIGYSSEKRYDTVSEDGLMAYERNLTSIIALAKSKKIGVILSSEASMLSHEIMDTYPKAFYSAARLVPTLSNDGLIDATVKYDEIVKSLAKRHNIPYADNLGNVPKDWKNFIDHIHLTSTGCEAVAKNFASAVKKQLILQKK